jgi:hypothetical protein
MRSMHKLIHTALKKKKVNDFAEKKARIAKNTEMLSEL